MNKLHLFFQRIDNLYVTWCSRVSGVKDSITKDSTKATCKNCLKAYLANKEKREEDETI